MNAIFFMSMFGLIGLGSGVILVNMISTPKAAQVGGIVAGFSVMLLACVAAAQIFH